MQPAGPALPELDRAGNDPVSAPEIGQRDRSRAETGGQFRLALLNGGARWDYLALVRCPRPDLGPDGPTVKIGFTLGPAHAFHATFNPHLAFERLPVKTERRHAGLNARSAPLRLP